MTFLTQWLGLSIFYPNWVKTTQHFLECIDLTELNPVNITQFFFPVTPD